MINFSNAWFVLFCFTSACLTYGETSLKEYPQRIQYNSIEEFKKAIVEVLKNNEDPPPRGSPRPIFSNDEIDDIIAVLQDQNGSENSLLRLREQLKVSIQSSSEVQFARAFYLADIIYLSSGDLSFSKELSLKHKESTPFIFSMAMHELVEDSEVTEIFCELLMFKIYEDAQRFYIKGDKSFHYPIGLLKSIKNCPRTEMSARVLLNYPFDTNSAPMAYVNRTPSIGPNENRNPGRYMKKYFEEIIEGTDLEEEFLRRIREKGLEYLLESTN